MRGANMRNGLIDSHLSCSQHVDKICNNVFSERNILYLPLRQRLLHYNSITHPTITYADVIWSFFLQKKAVRVILSADGDSPSVQLLIS